MTPEQAIKKLSAFAADFKAGMMDDSFVINMMGAIVSTMTDDQDDYDALMTETLRPWGIEYQPPVQTKSLNELFREKLK